ncbi:MAG: DNA repair helicase XPB [bacterium]
MTSPLILQTDGTLLLDSEHEEHKQYIDELTLFASLKESQGQWHKYEIDNLSLWNAAGAGRDPQTVIDWLKSNSKTSLSQELENRIREQMGRYGATRLVPADKPSRIKLVTDQPDVIELIEHEESPTPAPQQLGDQSAEFLEEERGLVKQYLAREGWPVVDLLGYEEGESLPLNLDEETELRDYQVEALDAYERGEEKDGGSGVVLLPCGAGKTVVGLGLMARKQSNTLIIATHRTARRQWKREILEKTNLNEDQVGEYSQEQKSISPVTLTTYNMLTYRDQEQNRFIHMDLFKRANWGLIIYDEVHLLPAPVFRATAEIQSKRRLGLTATLVREDDRESDVFSLIGPLRYDYPWQRLTDEGWISPAKCVEERVPLDSAHEGEYNRTESRRDRHRIAAENPEKLNEIERVLEKHSGGRILIIGYYLDFLEEIHERFEFPLITGDTSPSDRRDEYQRFRDEEIRGLVLSKVGNYSVDLPNADVLIQVSGTFGSRQEEAQRLGRVLRPNPDGSASYFYQLVTDETVEVEYARRRKRYLLRQGYEYDIRKPDEETKTVAGASS